MSFSPKSSRVSVPNAFAPRQNAGRGNFRESPIDRLGTVISYGQYTDASNASHPTIVVKEDESGRIYEARMSERAASMARTAQSSNVGPGQTQDNFRGNIIDDLMQKAIPVGDRVVLENTLYVKGGRINVGGEERSVVEANYITHVTEPSPKKAFRGIFTVKADTKRPDGTDENGSMGAGGKVRDGQIWEEQAIDKPEDIDRLVAELDEARRAYEAGERRPGRGVQFRAYVPAPENQGKPQVEVVDSSPEFEWVRAERDPNDRTKILSDGYPLDGEEFRNLYAAYKDYIFGNPAEGMEPKFDEATLATVRIEVLTCRSYMASGYSKYLVFSDNPKHPLRRLCFTPTKGSPDDETYMYGKNWATLGIVMLTGDQFDKKSNSLVTRDMIRRLFFNGPTGNLHSFIRTADGVKARASVAIDNPERAARIAAGNVPGATGGYNAPRPPQAPAAPVRAAAPAPVAPVAGANLFDDDDVPFEAAPVHAQPAHVAIPLQDEGEEDFFQELLGDSGSQATSDTGSTDTGSTDTGSAGGSSDGTARRGRIRPE